MTTLRFVDKVTGRMVHEGQRTPVVDIHLAIESLQPPPGHLLSLEDYVNMGPGYEFRPQEFMEYQDGKVEIEYKSSGDGKTGYVTVAVLRIECLKAETLLELRSMMMQRLGCKTISWSPAVETPSLVAVIRGDITRIRHWMRKHVQRLRQRLSLKLW